jgi:hypothetical protein
MLLMKESHVDWIIRHRTGLLLGGFSLIGLAFALPPAWKGGGLTAFTLIAFGVYGYALRQWRTDPGLWMLATLIAVLLTPCAAYFEIQVWKHWLAPAQAIPAPRAEAERLLFPIDAVIAVYLLILTVRFAASASIYNWRRTRGLATQR